MAAIWRPPHQSSMTEITVRWSDGRSGRISTAVSLECREVEVAAEVLQPFIGDSFRDVAGADAADDLDAVASPGGGHVEPAPSVRPAERAKVGRNLALLVWPIADGRDQHVPFVTLRGRYALDEEPAQPVGAEEPVQVGAPFARLAEGRLNGDSLGLAEGHHAQGESRAGVVVVNDSLRHPCGLAGVVPRGLALVRTFAIKQLYSGFGFAVYSGFGPATRHGEQAAAVERCVGKRDQGLMPGSVIPAQSQVAERPGPPCKVEDRLGNGGPFEFGRPRLPIVQSAAGEAGRRQLPMVPGQDHRTAAIAAIDRISGADLAGLVEND